jgi:glycine cleavage system H lipoate-binding protein
MAVVLLLSTFLIFALIDYFISRKQAPKLAKAEAPATTASLFPPAYVDGFAVPEQLRYHQSHTWLYRERRNLARVGVDEFAAVLAGRIEGIELPRPGQWIRQGQTAWSITRNGETVSMVSPTEGEILEVNPEVIKNPALLREDPYGKGWLLTVYVPDEETTSRNLVPASMVGSWMRQCVERLYALQPALAGTVAADGGRPVDDVLEHLPEANWKELAREFFLS